MHGQNKMTMEAVMRKLKDVMCNNKKKMKVFQIENLCKLSTSFLNAQNYL